MTTQTKENYLKAIYYLSQKSDKISLSELSKEMEVSVPTANSMVKRLQEQDWVIYEKYKPLRITKKGENVATQIVRKHRLTEMFLAQFMGFGWEEVHDIAEEIEHIQVNKFFDRMDELLGFPTIDPHGSPIPDKNGVVTQKKYTPLSNIESGKRIRICALAKSSKDFLLFLNRKQIKLGVELDVVNIEPFDKSITVSYNATVIVLSYEVCEKLLVEIIEV